MSDGVYERIECIHETSDTKVYLVRHIALDELRIQKCIRKATGSRDEAREARLLSSLRHTGIPVLYDYREDDVSICLTEEYIRGVSLAEYMLRSEGIPLSEVTRFIIEIGDILQYLHSHRPKPVIYRDLKPEHIILRDGHPILIDYGIALLMDESIIPERAGTPRYCAPEQLEGGIADIGCDIYALGRIAEELLTHCDSRPGGGIRRLIAQATRRNPSERPASVREWCDGWRRESEGVSKDEQLCTRIAVVGSERGVGTTHIAISLCAALNHSGRMACYVDRSGNRGNLHIHRNRSEYTEQNGIIYHGDFRGLAEYGRSVRQPDMPEGILVTDCGLDTDEACDADICLYICSTRPWKDGRPDPEIAGRGHCSVVMNPPDIGRGIRLARALGRRVYSFDYDRDPFTVTGKKLRLFRRLLGEQGIRLGARKLCG